MLAPLLAHQGGWDEILLVAAPILLFAVLLWFVNKRAAAQLAAEKAEEGDPSAD